MTARCKPGQINLVAAAPKGSIHYHETMHDLGTVLGADYFLNVRQTLVVGDTIRFARLSGQKLVETAELLVVSGGQKFQHVAVELLPHSRHNFTAQRADPAPAPKAIAKGTFTVARGYQCFEVRNEAGAMVSQHGTKADAEAACAELMGAEAAA
jgi:hypothetical protein